MRLQYNSYIMDDVLMLYTTNCKFMNAATIVHAYLYLLF